MEINIKKLNEKAVIPFKKYDSDYCYDCVATSCEEIAPNVYKYGLGIALECVREGQPKEVKVAISVRPRSSIYKTGMVLSNSVGTIDEDYRGEISAVFYHVIPTMPKYEVGDRICQIYLSYTDEIDFVEVDNLGETDRSNGGYGSTGK